MNIESEILEIKRSLKRIDEKQTAILNRPKKDTWIKISFLRELTGWNREKVRQARNQKLIEWRKGDNGFEYLLQSLPEQFIKKTA